MDGALYKERQLLALKDFYTKSLETHTRLRGVSVFVVAGLVALAVPGFWWALVAAGALCAISLEAHLRAALARAFASAQTLDEADVARLSQRTVWIIVALCWSYAAPYMAMAAAPAPGQIFALVFAAGALVVIAGQHAFTRTMASWTALPFIAIMAANAIVVAGENWLAFLLLPILTLANVYVVAGATHASASELIDARLRAQREAKDLELRVQARTKELDVALQQAQAASQAKSRFLATMSHELRTPLNAVIGFSEIIIDDVNDGRLGAVGLDAARVRAAGLHLLSVINEVLDITAIEAGAVELTPKPFDVRAMAEETVSQFRLAASGRGNRIDLLCPGEPGMISADPARVRQCLSALLSNAGKFTQGGVISLRVARATEPGGRALVRFEVADTGVGIAPDRLDQLFKPFTQIDDSYSRSADGSGLGLAITRRLARLMGGDVTVKSALGQGSAFTLTIADTVVKTATAA